MHPHQAQLTHLRGLLNSSTRRQRRRRRLWGERHWSPSRQHAVARRATLCGVGVGVCWVWRTSCQRLDSNWSIFPPAAHRHGTPTWFSTASQCVCVCVHVCVCGDGDGGARVRVCRAVGMPGEQPTRDVCVHTHTHTHSRRRGRRLERTASVWRLTLHRPCLCCFDRTLLLCGHL